MKKETFMNQVPVHQDDFRFILKKTEAAIMRSIMLLVALLPAAASFSQVAINLDGTQPHPSAMLEVKSTSKGLLIPRMGASERMAIPSPATGLLVFDTDSSAFAYYSSGSWKIMGRSAPVSGEPTLIIDTDNDTWVDTDQGGGDGDTIVFHIGDASGKGSTEMILRKNQVGYARLEFPDVDRNTFIGDKAGEHNAQGFDNTATGNQVLHNNYLGAYNTAAGSGAMLANTTGNHNTALGFNALNKNISGNANVAIGTGALYKVDQKKCVAIGDSALFNLTTDAPGNMAIGSKAGFSNTFGSYNTFLGFEAGMANDGLAASGNTFTGFQAGHDNASGSSNSFFGMQSGTQNVSGNENAAFGHSSFFSNKTGKNNVAVGFFAMKSNTDGFQNTATGWKALSSNISGYNNTAIGSQALLLTTGHSNTATGNNALVLNTSGIENTAMGSNAMYSNTTAGSNVAIGYNAMYYNSTGLSNTAIGADVMTDNTSGDMNTAIGRYSMGFNKTGSKNTVIGASSDVGGGDLTNATAIGYGTLVNASNKVRIGNTLVTKIEGQVAFTTPSDGRFKTDVRENVAGLDFINRLRPVTYQFDRSSYGKFIGEAVSTENKSTTVSGAAKPVCGFIAQEVEQAAKDAGFQFDGVSAPQNEKDTWSLAYSQFVVPLVKAVQEQQAQIIKLREQNAALEKRVQLLEKK